MRSYMPLAALVAVLLFSGCSSTPETPNPKNGDASRVSNADEQVLKQDPIERNYDPHVIMKRAEAFFEKEDYAEAIVEYQHFLDLHKTHTLAPYAQYRLGMSYFTSASIITGRRRILEPFTGSRDCWDNIRTRKSQPKPGITWP